jgi:NitT/TauT family transport system permease protein
MTQCGRCSARKSIFGNDRIEKEGGTMNDIAATAGSSGEAGLRAARRRSWLGKALYSLTLLLPGIVILIFWQWAAGRLIKEIYVSKPTAVAERLYELFSSGEIYPHLWTTGQELVLGYVIGVAGGILAGYALGRSPRLASIFEPYVMAFYGIPKIALAPLFIIWFGIGIWSKIALAAIMVFFLIFYNVYTGVRSVDRELVNLTLVMGANQRQLTYHVYFPAAAPYVLLGMRMAVPYSVIGVIVGEFTSSTQGLGLFIHEASSTYDPAGVFAGIVILLAFVVVANVLAGRLERRFLGWKAPSTPTPNEI